MERAFKGRRNQIVGDCVQLGTDVDSYNENVCLDDPIPMLWDFTDDVTESKQCDPSPDFMDELSANDFGLPSEHPLPDVLPTVLLPEVSRPCSPPA